MACLEASKNVIVVRALKIYGENLRPMCNQCLTQKHTSRTSDI